MAKRAKPVARKALVARVRLAKREGKRMNAVKPGKPARAVEGDEKAAALAAAKGKQAVRGKRREVALHAALGAVVRNDARRRGLDGSGLPDGVKVLLARKAAAPTVGKAVRAALV